MIKIKPHHFIDIIKLYGAGINNFVPDKNYQHDFYLIANSIIKNHDSVLKLTIDEDDICTPCKYINSSGICIDTITHLSCTNSKDEWNKTLDKRILEYLNLSTEKNYTANELCNIIFSNSLKIYDIWKEEELQKKEDRYNLFLIGSKKYLNL